MRWPIVHAKARPIPLLVRIIPWQRSRSSGSAGVSVAPFWPLNHRGARSRYDDRSGFFRGAIRLRLTPRRDGHRGCDLDDGALGFQSAALPSSPILPFPGTGSILIWRARLTTRL